MSSRYFQVWLLALMTAGGLLFSPATRAAEPAKPPADPGFLHVHEWGTFLTVQGSDGVTLGGMVASEEILPPFVETRNLAAFLRTRSILFSKMETPVTYFYTDRPREVQVRVDMPKGILTHWFPLVREFGPVVAPEDGTFASTELVPSVGPAEGKMPDGEFPFGDRAAAQVRRREGNAPESWISMKSGEPIAGRSSLADRHFSSRDATGFGFGIVGEHASCFVEKPPSPGKPEKPSSTVPAGVPLELRLLAKQDTYPLDLGGRTPADFRKQCAEAREASRELPFTQKVSLVLEVHNRGDAQRTLMLRRLKFQHPNTASTILDLSLDLTGPAVERVDSHLGPVKAWGGGRVPLVLEAGATYSVPINLLTTNSYMEDGDAKGFWSHQAFWLQRGEYVLTAKLTTEVSPAPKGAPAAGEGFGSVMLVSNAVKLKAIEAKR